MTRLLTAPSFVSRLAVGGSRTAIVTADDIAVSFEDLARRVDAVASQLGPGRRLVVIEPAGTEEAVTAYLGALRAGAVVLLAPAGGAPEFADRYRPSAVWTPETGFRFVPDAPERDLHPDLCLLLPTSGTTGSPRVVRLSYENVDANAAAIEGALGLGPDERAALVLPLSYCYGLSVLHSHLGAHGSVLLGMGSVTEDADWQRFTDLGGTSLAGVPRTFDLLERSGFADRDLPTLRTLTQAGGRMPPEQVARFARLGARRGFRLMVMYGQTEATARMAVLPADEAITHPGTIGRPVAGGRFELVPLVEGTAIGRVGSADDPIVPDGEVGELCYRGPNVMLGYARGPEDLGRGREIEVLRTGDLARRDPDGRYTIVGRRSRFVKPFGIRIDLDGLEAMLERAGIAAWCDGDDDGLRVLAEAGRADAVRRAVSERTRIPANRITVLEADPLPRLANGKPDRSRLRTAPVGSVAEGDLGVELAAVLGVVAVGDDDTFVGLGGDSLSYVEACGILERRIRRLPRDWPRRTVGELRALADSQPSRRWTTAVETSVVIRAVAIFFIVANHASWIPLQGGAHLLLVLAGYNYARFTLASPRRPVRRHGALLLRVGVPVLLAALLVAARLGLPDDGVRILLSQYVQPRPWRFWFGEALVHILVVCTLLTASTRFRTAERRRPLGTAVAVALAAAGIAVVSAAIWGRPAAPLGFEYRTEYVAWFFALGWVLARVTGPAARLAVSAVAVAVVPRFFDEPSRGAFVAAGILALTWIATITLPRLFARVLTVTAAASLAIYLVHYEDLYPYAREWSPFVVTVAGIVAGIAVHGIARVGKRVYVRVVRNRRNRAVPDGVPALAR